MVEDCCATNNERSHLGTLENVQRFFGEVYSSDEVIAAWEGIPIAK
jgi:hypothetical protein